MKKLRRRLAEGGRKLGVCMEESRDTLRRFGYAIRKLVFDAI